jgi:ABC-type oligopeptide transport system substrate-binding subunit
VARENLADIGIDLDIRAVPGRKYFSEGFLDDKPWDMSQGNFFIDYADPANFIGDLFGSYLDDHVLVSKRLARRAHAATRLPDAARLAAFARLDADLARAAVLAPYATSANTDFFSDRIGCQVRQPIYGISLGALCVRD